MAYEFQTQLSLGQEQEARLDKHFGSRFSIRESNMAEQKLGVDRWFTKDGRSWAIEYKADFKAAQTGNAYIESVSVGRWQDGTLVVEKLGWVHTSNANWLVYLVVGTGKIYIIRPFELRAAMWLWRERYPVVFAENVTYTGEGILVPLAELAKVASVVETLGE